MLTGVKRKHATPGAALLATAAPAQLTQAPTAGGCQTYRSAESQAFVSRAREIPHTTMSQTVIRLALVSPQSLRRVVPDDLERRVLVSRMRLCDSAVDTPVAGSMPIAMKYALIENADRDPQEWGSLYYEGRVYVDVAQRLVMQRWTPHFILPLEVGRCPAQCCRLSPNERALRSQLIESAADARVTDGMSPSQRDRIRDDLDRSADVQIIMTERSGGQSVYEFFRQPTLTIEHVRVVLFQIFWTLWQMGHVGAMHNDLHFGNMFVDTLPDRVDLNYVMGVDEHFVVPVDAFVRLYDFDWASMHGQPPNMNHRYVCRTLGVCSDFNPKFDAFTVLFFTHYMLGVRFPEVLQFVEDVLDPSLMKRSKFRGRLCRTVGQVHDDPQQNRCRGPLVPSDDEMAPLDAVLRHSFFAPFRRDGVPPPADGPQVYYDGAYAQTLPTPPAALPFTFPLADYGGSAVALTLPTVGSVGYFGQVVPSTPGYTPPVQAPVQTPVQAPGYTTWQLAAAQMPGQIVAPLTLTPAAFNLRQHLVGGSGVHGTQSAQGTQQQGVGDALGMGFPLLPLLPPDANGFDDLEPLPLMATPTL